MNSSLSCGISENIQRIHSIEKWNGSQRRIGVTGGIASGKSLIGEYLQQSKNLPIIDADIICHQILNTRQSIIRSIINRYGLEITQSRNNDNQSINRSALSKIIFKNKNERSWLENLIHPIVKEEILKSLEKLNRSPTVILIIPLLFEANMTSICSEIWLISCDIEVQCKRLMQRDNLSQQEAYLRISSQFPNELKKQYADFIINNNENNNLWKIQINNLL